MSNVDVSKHIILSPHHRLDLAGAQALKQEFVSILGEKYNFWIIDMTNVEFVDSSGLSALVFGLKTAQEHGYPLVVCNLKPTVKLVFEITQLDRVFEIFDNLDGIFSPPQPQLAIA
jgi:anti-anti-sigma factor